MLATAPALLVRLNAAGVLTPLVVAVTLKLPACVLAVKASDSWPLLLVVPLIVAVPLLNVPLAPLPGAVKVTVTPDMGLPLAALTVITSGLAKALPTVAVCGVPDVAVMLAGKPVADVALP